MSSGRYFNCCIIGHGKLTLDCAQFLLAQGHSVKGIISDNRDVRAWANEHHITNIAFGDDQYEFLSQWPFDYLFSIINPTQTPEEILSKPKISAINFHDAPLPKYAGLHVTSWAIQNQETDFGVTWHEMNTKFDAGDILKQSLFPIEADETAFSLSVKCYQKGKESFESLVSDIEANTLTRTTQNLALRSVYLSSQRPSNAALIDWNKSVDEICAFSRGLSYQDEYNPLGLPKVYFNNQFYMILLISKGR